jgi:hypothetical protein
MNKSKHISWALSISGALILWSLIVLLVHKAAITGVAMEAIHLNPKLAEQMLAGGKATNVAEVIILVIGLGFGAAIFWFPRTRVER